MTVKEYVAEHRHDIIVAIIVAVIIVAMALLPIVLCILSPDMCETTNVTTI